MTPARAQALIMIAIAVSIAGSVAVKCSHDRANAAGTGDNTTGDNATGGGRRGVKLSNDRFDGQRAFADMEAMVKRGERYYAAPGREGALRDMVNRFTPHVALAREQRFTRPHPDGRGTITMVNVVARQHPDRTRRLVLGSHWDTRLWAEEDADPMKQQQPIPGANDGTSGIALMIEVARIVERAPLRNFGLDYILFDGEEYGKPDSNEYCQGSRYLKENIGAFYPSALPEAAIVMDMVADADLQVPRETTSLDGARWLVDLVWTAAGDRGERAFLQRTITIFDDHAALLEAGIPSILLIDYDYAHWHTHNDTLDRCSSESLARVGSVVLEALRRIDAER
jgi:hypothetical protein